MNNPIKGYKLKETVKGVWSLQKMDWLERNWDLLFAIGWGIVLGIVLINLI